MCGHQPTAWAAGSPFQGLVEKKWGWVWRWTIMAVLWECARMQPQLCIAHLCAEHTGVVLYPTACEAPKNSSRSSWTPHGSKHRGISVAPCCRPGVMGEKCDRCQPGFHSLSEAGCQGYGQ